MDSKRLHWVDSLRGIAVMTMVIYHIGFNLNYLQILNIDVHSGIWYFLARFTEFTFLSLVGVSLYLSYRSNIYIDFLKKHSARAFNLILIAVGITAVTFFVLHSDYIRFGILHLIAFGIIIGALLIPFPRICFSMIFIPLIIGAITTRLNLNTELLVPFGITPDWYGTLDYFPLFPWLSLIFAGIATARFLNSQELLRNLTIRFRFAEYLGNHALLIYLIHLPLIYGILCLITK